MNDHDLCLEEINNLEDKLAAAKADIDLAMKANNHLREIIAKLSKCPICQVDEGLEHIKNCVFVETKRLREALEKARDEICSCARGKSVLGMNKLCWICTALDGGKA